MNFVTKVLGGALLAMKIDALKVGLLSDLHLHLRYDPTIGPRLEREGDCTWGNGTPSA